MFNYETIENRFLRGWWKMSIRKASETGDPPEGWGLQAKRGEIPSNEAYIEVRRSDEG